MIMGVSVNRLDSSVFFGTDEPEVIDTRFGKITLQKKNPIVFPRGMLGMPNKFNFFLTEFPSENLSKFKLLQCLDDYGLSFITLPVDLENGLITVEDLSAACSTLAIKIENLAILLVVSVHRVPGKVTLSVNARAPLLIDSGARLAAQYVFQSDKYKVQHIIST
jgi:flagellar assembly factor FliW